MAEVKKMQKTITKTQKNGFMVHAKTNFLFGHNKYENEIIIIFEYIF